jgi:hypothetical protein
MSRLDGNCTGTKAPARPVDPQLTTKSPRNATMTNVPDNQIEMPGAARSSGGKPQTGQTIPLEDCDADISGKSRQIMELVMEIKTEALRTEIPGQADDPAAVRARGQAALAAEAERAQDSQADSDRRPLNKSSASEGSRKPKGDAFRHHSQSGHRKGNSFVPQLSEPARILEAPMHHMRE